MSKSSSFPQEGPKDNSNEGEVAASLHRSKSLSNNRSRSSYQVLLNPETGLANSNMPFFFIPIILICCPSILKGQKCTCGYNNYYPANDFYNNQFNTFLKK